MGRHRRSNWLWSGLAHEQQHRFVLTLFELEILFLLGLHENLVVCVNLSVRLLPHVVDMIVCVTESIGAPRNSNVEILVFGGIACRLQLRNRCRAFLVLSSRLCKHFFRVLSVDVFEDGRITRGLELPLRLEIRIHLQFLGEAPFFRFDSLALLLFRLLGSLLLVRFLVRFPSRCFLCFNGSTVGHKALLLVWDE